MDNNNFNNDPNNGVTPENPGTPETGSTSQNDPVATPQNPYGANTTEQQGTYGTYGGTYGANPQNPYGTAYNAYGTVNGGPVDDNGKPLKNNFAMKLTFSILEIVSCNILSLVMGILGCVFTTKANNAYKEGRWEDFKSAKKTSAIVLWVGLVGVIISVIVSIVMLVGVFKTANDYVQNEDSFWTDDSDDDDDYDYGYDSSDDDYGYDDAIVGDDDSSYQDNAASNSGDVTAEGDIDLGDAVIFDAGGVTVTATSLSWNEDYDGTKYPEINVVIANDSDKDVSVDCKYFSINGVSMGYVSLYTDVTAGMKAKDSISCYYNEEWTYSDFEEIEYFTVCLDVEDANWNHYSEENQFYTVALKDDYAPYTPDGAPMIVSQDGIDIYYMGTVESEYSGGEFVFYAYNSSDGFVEVYANNLAVDGFMQSGSAYEDVKAGEGAFLMVYVYDEDVDVNSATSAAIQFTVYNEDTYETIVETGNVTFIQ
jgi:hypothetical protein